MTDNSVIKGIYNLPAAFRTALLTLNSDTALIIDNGYGTALKRAFLIKQIRYELGLEASDGDDMIIIGMANGGATIAEIASALATKLVDPGEASAWPSFISSKVILWETVRAIPGNEPQAVLNETISIGGGKGIPMAVNKGIQLFVFNPSANSLTTGATLLGLYQIIGVFMNDD